MGFKKILIFTPRILLNKQLTENKYSFYISDLKFKTVHFSNIESDKKDKTIIFLIFFVSLYYLYFNKLHKILPAHNKELLRRS